MTLGRTFHFETLDNGRLVVNRDFLSWLERKALLTFDAWLNFPKPEEVNNHRNRPVYRLDWSEAGEKRAVYLKLYKDHGLKHGVEDMIRLERPKSQAAREWHALLALEKAGIKGMVPVAMGEKFNMGFEKASFFVTEELEGLRPLDEYLEFKRRECSESSFRALKRELLVKAGALISGMHKAGILHGNLFLKHIVLLEKDEQKQLTLIDLQQTRFGRRVSKTDLAREFANLWASARRDMFNLHDALCFYRAYKGRNLKASDRRVFDKISRRAEKLLTRKKFQKIQNPAREISWKRA